MILELLKAGLLAVEDCVTLHVLTCLVPAFLLAGALVSFVNREAILDHLGVKKALVYAPTILVLGTLVGWLFGNLPL